LAKRKFHRHVMIQHYKYSWQILQETNHSRRVCTEKQHVDIPILKTLQCAAGMCFRHTNHIGRPYVDIFLLDTQYKDLQSTLQGMPVSVL